MLDDMETEDQEESHPLKVAILIITAVVFLLLLATFARNS